MPDERQDWMEEATHVAHKIADLLEALDPEPHVRLEALAVVMGLVVAPYVEDVLSPEITEGINEVLPVLNERSRAEGIALLAYCVHKVAETMEPFAREGDRSIH
jgi:hypothetical protein